MSFTTRQTVSYFILPQVIPRIMRIFKSGFAYIAFYMALVLNATRLIPDQHPYLNPENFGKFGIHHVMAQAATRLVFKKENTDQIIIYFALLLGVVILFTQFAFFIMAFFVEGAQAAGWGDYFITAAPEDDIAFIFLDRVFGLPGIFNSCVAQNIPCLGAAAAGPAIPTLFHQGLHTMFEYYNNGLAIIAFLLIIYYVIALAGETAKTGVPFGKRFDTVMAPVRLILALALMAPLYMGMNGAQLIGLQAAKFGSSLATNGWITFVDEIKTGTIMGDTNTLVVTPNPPQVNSLVEFTFVALTCKYAYEYITENNPDPMKYDIQPYVVFADKDPIILGDPGASDLNELLAFTENQEITLRFGHYNTDWYKDYTSWVMPLCGEMTFPLQDIIEPGAYYVQNYYILGLVRGLWDDAPNNTFAQNLVKATKDLVPGHDPTLPLADPDFVQATFDYFNTEVQTEIENGVLEQVTNGDWATSMTDMGWGGASLWYNKIAQFNGSLISSVYALPIPKLYPDIMEQVLEKKKGQNNIVLGRDRFEPKMPNNETIWPPSLNQQLAELFYDAQKPWMKMQEKYTGNFLVDAINMLFGFEGLINMRENDTIHPLAQLVGLGRALVESAIQNFGYAFGAGALGGLMSVLGLTPIGTVGKSAGDFFKKIAIMGLSIGIILFYVLPFLPFLYFFIALTNWVKTIFEAMVGLPLWALSHIRIDGKGVPGPAGMNGYYLIFEIFINPILIIFGMLAGMTIFAAQVAVLNEIWGLVVTNVSGTEMANINAAVDDKMGSIRFLRNVFDQFFFTCMYAILVYMMGLASFKLVDLIPDYILRWMGSSVKSFNQSADNMAGELTQKANSVTQSAIGNTDAVIGQMMIRNS